MAFPAFGGVFYPLEYRMLLAKSPIGHFFYHFNSSFIFISPYCCFWFFLIISFISLAVHNLFILFKPNDHWTWKESMHHFHNSNIQFNMFHILYVKTLCWNVLNLTDISQESTTALLNQSKLFRTRTPNKFVCEKCIRYIKFITEKVKGIGINFIERSHTLKI